jgi:hypothetical protein
MSKKRGAKGLRQSDIDEAGELWREGQAYEANLPSYMEPGYGGDYSCA